MQPFHLYKNQKKCIIRSMTQLDTYLTDRCISKEVQKYSNITFDGRRIHIPVYDKDGKFLFNKYRKDPADTNDKTPKYMYEKGSSFTVYGYFPEHRPESKTVFFVEGEFDALVMQSKGVHALTSTGGCSSFKKEWLDGYEEIYVCLDGDIAGYRSSAKIALLAEKKMKIYILNGMDITDFFKEGNTMQDFYKLSTIDYTPPDNETKSSYKKVIDDLMSQKRTLLQFAEDTTIIETLIDSLLETYTTLGKKITKPTGDINAKYDIARIKAVPISNFEKFGHDNKAHSVYNSKDKTASLHYYEEDNRFWDYSAGKGGDVIDFVEAKFDCTWKEAVAIINKHI